MTCPKFGCPNSDIHSEYSDTPEGPQSSLAELKTINAGRTWYPRGVSDKATDRRAALIPKEYEAKLCKYDFQFHGAQPRVRGHPGSLVQLLQSFPLQRPQRVRGKHFITLG